MILSKNYISIIAGTVVVVFSTNYRQSPLRPVQNWVWLIQTSKSPKGIFQNCSEIENHCFICVDFVKNVMRSENFPQIPVSP